jgi:hypothetical protein
MSCAAVNILAITAEDSGPRAAAYLKFAQTTLDKWVKNLVDHGNLPESAARQLHDELAGSWAKARDHYAENGIEPHRLGDNPAYWPGVVDRDLFKSVGRDDWWAQYYAPFSDSAHGSVSSMQAALRQAFAGRLDSGPRDVDAVLVLSASSDLLIQAFTALNNYFGTDAGDLLEEFNRLLNTELAQIAHRDGRPKENELTTQ